MQTVRVVSRKPHNIVKISPPVPAKLNPIKWPIARSNRILAGERSLIEEELFRRNIRIPQCRLSQWQSEFGDLGPGRLLGGNRKTDDLETLRTR